MSDVRPTTEWPKLLVGPMLRRVTTTRAHVFIATKMAATARVRLYAGRQSSPGGVAPSSQIAEGPQITLDRIGERLFVGLLAVDIPSSHGPGSTFSYDVVIDDSEGSHTLQTLGLLGGSEAEAKLKDYSLGYAVGVLPSFVSPPSEPGDVFVVHASCRKPHGGGTDEPDGIQLLDAALNQNLNEVHAPTPLLPQQPLRPQQLILTGDQIYADDVAPGLLQSLTATGDALLGWQEDLPLIDDNNDFIVSPGWRTRYLSLRGVNLKRLPTTDDGTDYSQSHLLRFGEWVAMYIFAWSDALWPRDTNGEYDLPEMGSRLPLDRLQQAIEISDSIGLITVPDSVDRALGLVGWLTEFGDKLETTWNDTRNKAIGYAKSVRCTRRVMANCPTYTMFDDHEITDDWYLSQRVHDKLKGTSPQNEVGPRMLRNGLSAYAIFQHWGNAPEDFKPLPPGQPLRHGQTLLAKWRFTDATSDCELKNTPRSADTILGIDAGDSPIPASNKREDFVRFRWDYAIGFPAHRLVALDTRTWRFFPHPHRLGLRWSDLAPLTPNQQATFGSSGADEIRTLAAAWRQAGQDATSVPMGHFANLLDAYVAVAEARNESLPILRARAITLLEYFQNFEGSLFYRRTNLNLDDPISDDFYLIGSDVAQLVEKLGTTAKDLKDSLENNLPRLEEYDFGPLSYNLTAVLEALNDFCKAAWHDSMVGLVHSAHRVARHAGTALWSLFTAQTESGSTFTTLESALATTLNTLGGLIQSTGLDQLDSAIFRSESNRVAPGLIRSDALSFMVTEPLDSLGSNHQLTFFLSPAPIFGNRLVEMIQRLAVVKEVAQGNAGEEEFDFEPWSGNIPAMIDFFEAARSINCAIVLSGDVHYAGSSVVKVKTAHAATRYIQLTSSPTRNSDSKTRNLALLDDLLYDNNGEIFFIQSDWASLMQAAEPTKQHLKRLARDKVEGFLISIDPINLAHNAYEDWKVFWDGPNTIHQQLVGAVGRVLNSPFNTVRELSREAVWQLEAAKRTIIEYGDDPILKIFGDYLTAPAFLIQQLHDFYEKVGLDPSNGLQAIETVLVDRRPNRLSQYPVNSRFIARPAGSDEHEHKSRRTVGHANVGFIQVIVSEEGQIKEIAHELRWYPLDEPARIEHVSQDPVPRLDWYGTFHRAGWYGNSADPVRHRP